MLKSDEVKIGSIVRLVSGSPKMTVTDIGTDADGNLEADVIFWTDRLGFVTREIGLEFLCWPYSEASA